MAMYTIDSAEVSASAARVGQRSAEIRSQVEALMADLLALEGSWTGVAQAGFQACITDWRATQAQVEASLDAIGLRMGEAAAVYEEAEARSASLFAS